MCRCGPVRFAWLQTAATAHGVCLLHSFRPTHVRTATLCYAFRIVPLTFSRDSFTPRPDFPGVTRMSHEHNHDHHGHHHNHQTLPHQARPIHHKWWFWAAVILMLGAMFM